MSELGGLDIGMPDERTGGGPEALTDDAKQRFAAAAAAMQQIRREEKKSKKRDDQVAKTILKFLSNQDNTRLFVLISRLVARDCPSIFILAILSLIDEESTGVVQAYLQEVAQKTEKDMIGEASMAVTKSGQLDADANAALVAWITRMQMVLAMEPEKILMKLMIDERNIDGTVLQLTTFVLQEFFVTRKKTIEFSELQPLTASILQSVFQPFVGGVRKLLAERAAAQNTPVDEDD